MDLNNISNKGQWKDIAEALNSNFNKIVVEIESGGSGGEGGGGSTEIKQATSTTLGGIKIGYTDNNKNYSVKLDVNGRAYVNVPWTDTNTTYTWDTLPGKPTLATVAITGSYNDLLDKPNISGEYILPTASSTTKGGITLGYTQNGTNYPIVLDGSGKAYVSVPWNVLASISNNGLLSSSDKTKLDSIQEGANNYTLPISSKLSLGGIKVGDGLEIEEDGTLNCTIDPDSGVVSWNNIQDKPSFSTVATSGSYNDLTDKPNITPYTLPIASNSKLGGVLSSTTGTTPDRDYKVQVNLDGTMKVNVPWTDNNTTYSNATTEVAGLMSSTDKQKLNGIDNNANNYSLPPASTTTLGGIKVGDGLEIEEDGKLNCIIDPGSGTVSWGNIQGKPSFATVATSGSYNDLTDKPEIDTAITNDEIDSIFQ